MTNMFQSKLQNDSAIESQKTMSHHAIIQIQSTQSSVSARSPGPQGQEDNDKAPLDRAPSKGPLGPADRAKLFQSSPSQDYRGQSAQRTSAPTEGSAARGCSWGRRQVALRFGLQLVRASTGTSRLNFIYGYSKGPRQGPTRARLGGVGPLSPR